LPRLKGDFQLPIHQQQVTATSPSKWQQGRSWSVPARERSPFAAPGLTKKDGGNTLQGQAPCLIAKEAIGKW